MTVLTAEPARFSRYGSLLFAGWCLVVALAPPVLYGPALVDDAYITMRYARNLAGGQGLVFNPSEGPIQGASTPLFTLLLALGHWLGFSLPGLALSLGALGAFGVFFFGGLLLKQALARSHPPGFLAGAFPFFWPLALAGLPQWSMVQISGMESPFFVGLALGALYFFSGQRWRWAFCLAGLAVLTRYDGWAFFALLLAAAGRDFIREPQGRRPLLQGLGLGLLLPLAWAVFAVCYFGQYAPHSVETKRLIHQQSLGEGLQTQLAYLWGSLPAYPGLFWHRLWLPFALGGVTALLRRPGRPALLPLWGLVSALGFAASGIEMFRWYFLPLLTGFAWSALVAGGLAVHGLERRQHRGGAMALAGFLLLLALAQWGYTLPGREQWPRALTANERAYLQCAEWLKNQRGPGTVLVGEVGALAWALEDWRVLDSSGINSREILGLRKGHPENWPWLAMQRFRPDALISLPRFLDLQELQRRPDFQRLYQRVRIFQVPPSQQVWVYFRR